MAYKYKTPLVLTSEVTLRCNLNCKHCFVHANENIHNELSKEELLKVYKKFSELGCLELNITGGEPFIRKDILDILRESSKYFKRIFLSTNGLLIDEKIADELKNIKELDSVMISLDGTTKETHEKLRCSSGSFEKALRAIKLLRERRMRVIIGWTINRYNKNEIYDLVEFSKKIDVPFLHINPLIKSGRALENFEDIGLGLKELFEIKQEFKRRFKDEKDVFIIFSYNPCYFHFYDLFLAKEQGEDITPAISSISSCLMGMHSYIMDPYGNILLCPVNRHIPELNLGNVKKQTVEEIYANAKTPNPKRRCYSKCSVCRYQQFCFGGCPYMDIECPHEPPKYADDKFTAYPYVSSLGVKKSELVESNLPSSAIPKIANKYLFREEEKEGLIYELKSGDFFIVNKTASNILKLVDGKSSIRQIADHLLNHYEVSKEKLEKDIKNMLANLHKREIIRF